MVKRILDVDSVSSFYNSVLMANPPENKMRWTEVLKKLGIALLFVLVAVILTGAVTFSWLLGLLIFYLELKLHSLKGKTNTEV